VSRHTHRVPTDTLKRDWDAFRQAAGVDLQAFNRQAGAKAYGRAMKGAFPQMGSTSPRYITTVTPAGGSVPSRNSTRWVVIRC
jgi:hypothetical protein